MAEGDGRLLTHLHYPASIFLATAVLFVRFKAEQRVLPQGRSLRGGGPPVRAGGRGPGRAKGPLPQRPRFRTGCRPFLLPLFTLLPGVVILGSRTTPVRLRYGGGA